MEDGTRSGKTQVLKLDRLIEPWFLHHANQNIDPVRCLAGWCLVFCKAGDKDEPQRGRGTWCAQGGWDLGLNSNLFTPSYPTIEEQAVNSESRSLASSTRLWGPSHQLWASNSQEESSLGFVLKLVTPGGLVTHEEQRLSEREGRMALPSDDSTCKTPSPQTRPSLRPPALILTLIEKLSREQRSSIRWSS